MNEDIDGPWDFNDFIVEIDSEEDVEDEDADAEDEDKRNNPLSLAQIAGEEIRRILTTDRSSPSDQFISDVKILGEMSHVSSAQILIISLSVKRGLLQKEIKKIQQTKGVFLSFNPTLFQIARSALLAFHGLLGPVLDINLEDVDLTSSPSEHLAALASCVTGEVRIKNVKGLVSFLDDLECENLIIRSQSLSSDETVALFRATEKEKRVKNVDLKTGVTLELDCLEFLPEIAWSANLANQGLLGSVREIRLLDIDLSSVPGDHLASLASCVTEAAHVDIVRGCDIVGFLDSLKCVVEIHLRDNDLSHVSNWHIACTTCLWVGDYLAV